MKNPLTRGHAIEYMLSQQAFSEPKGLFFAPVLPLEKPFMRVEMTKNLPGVMGKIGFRIESDRHYKHPKCKHLFVEFSSGPAGVCV